MLVLMLRGKELTLRTTSATPKQLTQSGQTHYSDNVNVRTRSADQSQTPQPSRYPFSIPAPNCRYRKTLLTVVRTCQAVSSASTSSALDRPRRRTVRRSEAAPRRRRANRHSGNDAGGHVGDRGLDPRISRSVAVATPPLAMSEAISGNECDACLNIHNVIIRESGRSGIRAKRSITGLFQPFSVTNLETPSPGKAASHPGI